MKKFLSSVLALTMCFASLGFGSCLTPPGASDSSTVSSVDSSKDSSAGSSATHTHTFGDWARVEGTFACEDSTFKRVCSDCNATEERNGSYDDHVWSAYAYDVTHHWASCAVCGSISEKQPHVLTAENDCQDCKNPVPTDCVSYEASSDGIYAIVTGYDEAETDAVIISPLFGGLPVKEIQSEAFKGCTKLESVMLPLGLTTVGDNAFNGCKSLTGIYLRASVTHVGDGAFTGCSELSIFCETESAPEGFSENWNASKRPVYWNYQGEAMSPVSWASTTVLDSPLVDTYTLPQIAPNPDLNGVRAPEGFTTVRRFDGVAERWESSTLWTYNYDTTDLSGYKDVWFAMKVVGGFWAFVDGTPSVSSPTWMYFHLRQVGMNEDEEIFWDIEASFGGQVWAVSKNLNGATLDKNRPANSIPRLIWNNAFHSASKNENAFLIYHEGTPPTIYCTEVRATTI